LLIVNSQVSHLISHISDLRSQICFCLYCGKSNKRI